MCIYFKFILCDGMINYKFAKYVFPHQCVCTVSWLFLSSVPETYLKTRDLSCRVSNEDKCCDVVEERCSLLY